MGTLFPRVAASVAVAVAVATGAGYALRSTATSSAALAALAALCGLVAGLLVARVLFARTLAELDAVSEGLLRLREREYGSRVALERRSALAELIERFNRLSTTLRADHDDGFQRELLLEALVESAPTAIVLCNELERVVLSNGVARGLLFSDRAPEGTELGPWLADRPELRDALARREDGFVHVEDQHESQETIHVAKRYFTLGTQPHTLYVLKVMTRELVREETEAWKKAIRIISHEMNNSLAAISSLLHSGRLILGQPEHMHRLARVFETLGERTSHLREFLEGYAELARLPRPTHARVEWGALLESVRALYPFALASPLPAQPGWFDPAQIQQVLINLLKNALESGSPGDAIEVAFDEQPHGLMVSVLDRGPGMSDEELDKALLPFFSTKKTGSGLGLALCREIVHAHEGTLRVERRDGGGLAVRFVLPHGPKA